MRRDRPGPLRWWERVMWWKPWRVTDWWKPQVFRGTDEYFRATVGVVIPPLGCFIFFVGR